MKEPDGEGREGADGATGTKPGTGGGDRGGDGRAGGGNRESETGWYYAMIHDRFYSRWEQPRSIIESGQRFVATVRIRIEKDGKISSAELAHSSGNPVMDESVMAAANAVTQVDPLPSALAKTSLEVKINFELNQADP